jgi:uncharacterized protein (DUF302 family)
MAQHDGAAYQVHRRPASSRPPSSETIKKEKTVMMTYTINRMFDGATFEEVEARTRAALSDQGFGVLTEIDVTSTMKKKLNVEMQPYVILGACNPRMAHRAIELEPHVGAMLPCNVILRAVDGGVEVSAVDPVASMQAIDNPELHAVASQVRDLMAKAVAAI